MPLVSIVVPVYKVESYLEKCITSIINQTYNDLEIILVDDGSPDSCPSMCDKYLLQDNRIRVIHKNNGGLSDARNAGIDIAKGEYICFVDSDDWVSLDMVERLLKACLDNNVYIATCSYYEVSGEKFKLNSICNGDKIVSIDDALCELIEAKTFKDFACNKIYNRHLFDEIRYPKGRNLEDIATTYKLFLKVNKIAMIETALYYYRINRLGSITTEISLKTVADAFDVHKKRYDEIKNKIPSLEDRLLSYILIAAITFYIRYRETEETIYIEKFKEIEAYIKNNRYRPNKYVRRVDVLKYNVAKINIYLYKSISKLYKKIKKSKVRTIYFYLRRIYLSNITKYYNQNILNTKNKKVVLFGLPEHNNLGDHAIKYAEEKLISQLYPKCQLFEVSEESTDASLKFYKKFLSDSDIVALTGGGDIGSQYLYIEHRRQRVIKAFPRQKIVIFPQTIFFTNDSRGKKELARSKSVYSAHKNLTMYLREKKSYDFAKKEFCHNIIKFCPDIVLSLNMTIPHIHRDGVLICLRSDLEGKNTIDNLEKLRQVSLKKFKTVNTTDTAIWHNVEFKEQEEEIRNKLKNFKKHSLVITDRLHGVIFCAITSTPCIALSNYNHKVKGICELLSGYKFIKYANSIETATEFIENYSYDEKQEYNVAIFDKYYNELRKEFISW